MWSDFTRVKLIISGGGTRGIYQVGALKALVENELLKNVVSISGCSIGAINAAMYIQHSIDDMYRIWLKFLDEPLFRKVDHNSKLYPLQLVKETLLNNGLELDTLRQILNSNLDESLIRSQAKEFVLSTFNYSKRRVEYHTLDTIPDSMLFEYIIASARLPVFQNHTINGDIYLDGGFVDNEPFFTYLDDKHFDLIIRIKTVHVSTYLFNLRKKNISGDQELLIKPSGKLGFPLNFKSPSFEARFEMGYNDANHAIQQLKTARG